MMVEEKEKCPVCDTELWEYRDGDGNLLDWGCPKLCEDNPDNYELLISIQKKGKNNEKYSK